ncbi:MAG TPA: methyltransferase domain-containing protein [Terracidiphilus sp.]|nr:methyltransferase domain-containing protein [Terracidiphilus sp.]
MQIPADQRIQRARTFDEIAELYDRGRREPPGWLYDVLFSSSGLDPSARILEIGCATAKSTLPLARRGCHVVALEMGANLARLAQQHLASFPRVRVINTRFEDWEAEEPFDLILAVTAWHWLDPKVRYARAAAALKTGGILAFSSSEQAFPPDYDLFFEQIQDAYEAVGAGRLPQPFPPHETIADSGTEIEQSGFFDNVRVLRRLWTEEFTADEHVAMMQTASDHRLIDSTKREWLFAEMRRLIESRPGGRIRKHNLTLLHLARKRIQ